MVTCWLVWLGDVWSSLSEYANSEFAREGAHYAEDGTEGRASSGAGSSAHGQLAHPHGFGTPATRVVCRIEAEMFGSAGVSEGLLHGFIWFASQVRVFYGVAFCLT